MNIPQIDKLSETINRLNKIDLSEISLLKLDEIIRKSIITIPFTTALMNKGHYIYRARLNRKCEDGRVIMFNSEREISYRDDLLNIRSYGRANFPGQSLFYGSFDSETIETTRITNFFEIDELRELENTDEEIYLTIGKWRIKDTFEVIEIVFNQKSIENNPDVKRSYEHQLSNFSKSHPEKMDEIKLILEFFSDQFAKVVNRKKTDDYKISALYTNTALDFYRDRFMGVTYPSVPTNFEGLNIALTPHAVERYLELEAVGMFAINTKSKHTILDNAAFTTDLGTFNTNFNWVHQKRMTEDEMNEIFLKK